MNHMAHLNRINHPCCMKRSPMDQVRHGLFWGGALVLFGILFLLQHLGHLGNHRAMNFWPLLLIVGGLLSLFRKGHRACGLLFTVIGGLALMSTLNILSISWSLVWPLAIIGAGILMVYKVVTLRWQDQVSTGQSGLVLGTAVMGSKEDRIDSQEFEGGEVTAVMGSQEIDLSQAEIKGQEATLKAVAVMGSVEIRAAAHWRVVVQGNPVLGSVEDRTREPLQGVEKPKTLIIQAIAILGSVEIRN